MGKKIVIIMMIISVMFCGSTFSAYAQEIEYDYRNYDTLFDTDEYDIIMTEVLDDPLGVASGIYSSAESASAEGSVNVYDSAYKVYELDNMNFLRTGQGSFVDMLSDEYMWMVNTPKGETVQVELVDGEWSVVGTRVPTAATVGSDIINMEDLYEVLNTLESENGIIVNEIICFESWDLCGNYVLILTDTEEYIIPFSYRPDWTGLTNGVMYTAETARQTLYEKLDIASWGSPGETENVLIGGNSSVESTAPKPTANQNFVTPIVCTVVLIGLLSSMLFFMKKKNA